MFATYVGNNIWLNFDRSNHFSVYHCTSTAMFPTLALRNFACRITLFTRSNCKLCSDAKEVLSNVWDKRPFEYDEINVMEHSDQKWKNMYEFDTPVVSTLCAAFMFMILTVSLDSCRQSKGVQPIQHYERGQETHAQIQGARG
jgi:glutaredoxin